MEANAQSVLEVDRPRFGFNLTFRLVVLSRSAAGASTLIGAAVLTGYVTRWKLLIQVHPSLPPMYPNTALALLIGGASALAARTTRNRHRVAAVAGFVTVALLGIVTLALHITGAGSSWLEVLWPDNPAVQATTNIAGRPAPETCIALACIGVAGALLCGRRAAHLSQTLAVATMAIGTSAILGYFLGVNRTTLPASFPAVGMALHTAVALTLLGCAVLFAQPTTGLLTRLTQGGPTARVGRQLITAVVIAPISLSLISAVLQRNVPDARLAQSIFVITQILALALLVMRPLRSAAHFETEALNSLRSARHIAEAETDSRLIADTLSILLTSAPKPLAGWNVGFRQSVAFGELPGDVCALLQRSDELCLVSVIDMAGHGTKAALQALRIRTELTALWNAGLSIHQIGHSLNESVSEMSTIASGILLSLDPNTGKCDYINAGHPPVIVSRDGTSVEWPTTHRIFGFGAWTSNRTKAHLIERNSFVVAYTDGVTEARSSIGEFVAYDVIQRALRLYGATGAQAVADSAVDAALEHSRRRLQDDALALVLHRP